MKKELIKYIIFGAIIIGAFSYIQKCNDSEVITEIDTILITSIKTQLIPVVVSYPVLSEVEKVIYVDKIKYKDSIRIDSVIKYITDYLTENTYKDTIINDSVAKIIMDYVIYRNKIKERTANVKIYSKIPVLKHGFSVYGGVFYMNTPTMSSGGLNAGVIHKKNIYEVSLGTEKTRLFKYSRILFTK